MILQKKQHSLKFRYYWTQGMTKMSSLFLAWEQRLESSTSLVGISEPQCSVAAQGSRGQFQNTTGSSSENGLKSMTGSSVTDTLSPSTGDELTWGSSGRRPALPEGGGARSLRRRQPRRTHYEAGECISLAQIAYLTNYTTNCWEHILQFAVPNLCRENM